MNIKDKILGKRISGIFNALNILLGLFCIIYYSINANRVNEFNKAVDFYLVLAIMCCGIYVFADYVIADIFNLIAVVFITLSITNLETVGMISNMFKGWFCIRAYGGTAGELYYSFQLGKRFWTLRYYADSASSKERQPAGCGSGIQGL